MSQTILTLLALLLTACSIKEDISKMIKRKPSSVCLINSSITGIESTSTIEITKPTDTVMLLLPLSGNNERIGKGILNSCIMAIKENSETTIEFCVIDTEDHELNKNLLFSKSKNVNLRAIIGPIFYTETKKFGALFPHTPIFALSNNLNANNNHVFACGLSPQDEIKKLFSYAKAKKLDTFLIMLPDSTIGNDVLKCIKDVLKISSFDNNDEYEVIKYSKISKKDATKYANNSGKKAVFVIEPILNMNALNDIQVFSLSAQVLSDMDAWSGSIFAFVGNQKLNYFIKEYKNTFGVSPSVLDIIGYDVTKIVYEMISQSQHQISSIKSQPYELDFSKKYKGCLGEFQFIKNRGLKRKLELFQSE